MRRIFHLIVILIFPNILMAQDFFSIIDDLSDYGAYQDEKELVEIFRETDFKLNNLKMVNLIDDKSFPYLEPIMSSFYLYDINGDDFKDVIYYGWGISVPQFKILLNQKDKLHPIFEEECVELIELKKEDNSLIVKYLKTSCGGNDIAYVDIMTLYENPVTNEWGKTSCKSYFYNFTLLPKNIEFEKRFEIKNETYNLRLTPEIKDNNTQAVFRKGDEGTAFASIIDETGRIWWFVLMDNNINKLESDFDFISSDFMNPQKARKLKWYGWISSRYVEEIK